MKNKKKKVKKFKEREDEIQLVIKLIVRFENGLGGQRFLVS